MVYYVFRFLQIWSIFAIITILFSFLVMCSTFNIFKKAEKDSNLSFIPVYNLLILLDIVKMSRLCFILLLFPVINVLVMIIIMYRLSIVFQTSTVFALGLMFLAVIFLPLLNFSKYSIEKKEEKNLDDVTDSMMPILTEQQYKDLNKIVDDTPKVDNVFKAQIKEIPPAPTFKANKIKYREMVIPEEKVEEIKKVEPVEVQDIYTNRFINTSVTEEDDSIEIVEL
jgi:hypothetical protein